jgi:hypothetical protein
MPFTSHNRWACAAAIGGAALVIYNPWTYWFVDTLAMGKGYVASNHGSCPSGFGYFLHTVVLFFAVYGILSISWACD